jgi:hypothetical protein
MTESPCAGATVKALLIFAWADEYQGKLSHNLKSFPPRPIWI